MAVMDSIKSKFDRYEYTIKLLTAKLQELADENERLTSALGAHGTLKSIYADRNQPAGLRVKAASASLVHEKPRLMPERAAVDSTCEEVIPLAELIKARRARQDALEGKAEVVPDSSLPWGQRVLDKPDGDGSTDDGSSND